MCGVLFFIIGLQTIAYSILWDLKFLARFVFVLALSVFFIISSVLDKISIFTGNE